MIKNRFRLAYKVPPWLYELPAGDYSLEELKDVIKISPSNLYMRFMTLGVEKTYMRIGKNWRFIYHWQGAEYYLKKAFELESKKLLGGFIKENDDKLY